MKSFIGSLDSILEQKLRRVNGIYEALNVDFSDIYDGESEDQTQQSTNQEEEPAAATPSATTSQTSTPTAKRKPGASFVPGANWKDPYAPGYDRQYAEDVLFHTIGPLTASPKYETKPWTSRGGYPPPPGYQPGGAAPQWTQDEVAIAYAGDMNALYSNKPNPRSPKAGSMGGAPLYRIAKKIAGKYGRGNDNQFINDLYQNGAIELSKMMQPGVDESRSAFISFVTRNIAGAIEHGIGGSLAGIKAKGGEATQTIGGKSQKTGLRGLDALLAVKKPAQAIAIADQIKGPFRTKKSYDKHPDNPFEQYSSRVYAIAMDYADALESGDQDRIEATQARIRQLQDEIELEETPIRGASTGLGQAVSTGSRKNVAYYRWTEASPGQFVWAKTKKTFPDAPEWLGSGSYEGETRAVNLTKGVSSLDVEDDLGNKQDVEAKSGRSLESKYFTQADEDSEVEFTLAGREAADRLNVLLQIALNYNLSGIIAKSPKLNQIALDLGAETRKPTAAESQPWQQSGIAKIGGPMSANEFRFVLRHLGKIASQYPGKGVTRSNLSKPRDAVGWWSPNEDPEIEPTPSGELWHSIWTRRDYPQMHPKEIQDEMTAEVKEFEQLGIQTARSAKAEAPGMKSTYIDKRTGKEVDISKKTDTAISNKAVSTAYLNGLMKLRIAAATSNLNRFKAEGFAESYIAKELPILESMDAVDFMLLQNASRLIAARLDRALNECRRRYDIRIPFSRKPIKAILTMPTEAALHSFINTANGMGILQTEGREAVLEFSHDAIPYVNIAAQIACEDNHFAGNDYLVSIKRPKSINESRQLVLKNAAIIRSI
jgi:hypothetical protein